MELFIEQSKLKWNYEYKIFEFNRLIFTGKVNRTILPNLRRILLLDLFDNEVCSLKQESWSKLILQKLPLAGLFKSCVCPYEFYDKNINAGYLRPEYVNSGHVFGTINGKRYELWENSGNKISIYCEEKQVGLIERESIKKWDGDKYRILYSKSLEKELAIIFCLLSDILWHTSDRSFSAYSWNNTIQLTGKKRDETWSPED